jgi:phage antirepressor YoqD-like protein
MITVEKMAAEPLFGTVSKIATVYNDRNQTINTYLLTKKQAIAVGAKLKTALLTKVINRLEELESAGKPQIPGSFSEALQLAANQQREIEEKDILISKKNQTIANVIHNHNMYTASQVAKDMPHPISAKLMNKMLRDAEVIFKQNGTWQLYSRYANNNLAEIKETKPDRNGATYLTLKWTSSGKSWIYKNWETIKQRVSAKLLSEWEVAITKNIPNVPMPRIKDRNF